MAGEYQNRGAAQQIEAFLTAHPTAPLTVAVGFASVRGPARLAERTEARPVTLVIGDCRSQRFAKASDVDRATVTAFLDRGDVVVKNWYRKRPVAAEARLKVWVVHTDKGPAALVGSANLTGAGLFRNWEMVTEACASDLARVVGEVDSLAKQALDAKARLSGYVKEPGTARASRKQTAPTPKRRTTPAKGRPKGCLSGLAQLAGWATLLLAATVVLVGVVGR